MNDVVKESKTVAAKTVMAKATAGQIMKALASVCGVVERRNAMPILANVLMVKQGDTIGLTTTDLEIQLQTQVSLGGGSGSASTSVQARKLLDIVKALPEEQIVTMTLDGSKMNVVGGKSRFTVQTLAAEDFPLVTEAKDYGAKFEVPQKTLKDLISQVAYCMAVSDVRYFLNGLLLVTDGKTMRVVATDGNRLATDSATVEEAFGNHSVIVPRKTVLELSKLLKDVDDPVSIKLASNQASFEFNGMKLITKLVEGKFPDYQRVIPASVKQTVVMERSMLHRCLSRAALMASEKFKGVRLSFKGEKLAISVSADGESADEEVGIDYEGGDVEIGFNVSYLLAALENMGSDTVTVGLRGGEDSILIGEPGRPNFKSVVMPLRI